MCCSVTAPANFLHNRERRTRDGVGRDPETDRESPAERRFAGAERAIEQDDGAWRPHAARVAPKRDRLPF